MSKMKRSLYEYDNYRVFLKDFYEHAKATQPQFSYRYFARVSQVGSPSFLKHVIDGKRNLTPPLIEKFAKALKLNSQETTFFRNLVMLNQAKNTQEREAQAQEIAKHKMFLKFQSLNAAQLAYYEHWYYVAIRELVTVEGFQEDPEWIAKAVSPPITASEAKKGLDVLFQLGLLQKENGRIKQSETLVSTGNEVSSAFVAKFHKEMMKKAAEAIDLYPRSDREISSGTFGVSEQTFKMIKEKTQKFRKEMQELAAQDIQHDFVCQLNFQIFPLSRKRGEKN